MKLSSIRSDLSAEVDGVWAEFEDGFKLKIASSLSPAFQDALDKALEPYRDLIRSGKLDAAQREKIYQEVASAHLVKDWAGLESDDGQPLAYSHSEAFAILSDPRMHVLWKWVQSVASNDQRYRERSTRDAVGNSRPR